MNLVTPTKSKVIVTLYRSPSQNHGKFDEFLSGLESLVRTDPIRF